MKKIHIYENGFVFKLEICDANQVTLQGFSELPFAIEGKDFRDFKDSGNQIGRLIELAVFDNDLKTQIITHFQFIKGSCDVKIWSTLISHESQTESLPKLFTSASKQP